MSENFIYTFEFLTLACYLKDLSNLKGKSGKIVPQKPQIMPIKIDKARIVDFVILTFRWYLAYYMVDYGWGKIIGEQFGVHDPGLLEKPVKSVDKFYLAWHLFGLDRTFDIVVGSMQIIGAVLIVINRTVLLGALFLLPILFQIFLIDIAFTTTIFGTALPVRLAGMILADLLILFYYKDRMLKVWKLITSETTTRFKYKWWIFLLLPLLGFLTDFVFSILSYPVRLFFNWLMH